MHHPLGWVRVYKELRLARNQKGTSAMPMCTYQWNACFTLSRISRPQRKSDKPAVPRQVLIKGEDGTSN